MKKEISLTIMLTLIMMLLISCDPHVETATQSPVYPITLATVTPNGQIDISHNTSMDTDETAMYNPLSEPTGTHIATTEQECEETAHVIDIPQVRMIIGEVFYNGIAINQLLVERPEAIECILGSSRPTDPDICGQTYYYDDMQITYSSSIEKVFMMNLRMFEINGVTLDKSREELISLFGEPIEFFEYPSYPGYPDHQYRDSDDDRNMRYNASGSGVDYVLEFWFDHPGDEAYGCSCFLINPHR